MIDYIFEIGLLCFALALVGVFLTVGEFRRFEERSEARRALRRQLETNAQH